MYTDNGDGTITDTVTGLMWMQSDSDSGMNWQKAFDYAETSEYAGYSDWRLPSAKELESIVDYTRSPGATGSPSINPVFTCTGINNECDISDYPFYWSSTTHASNIDGGKAAVYICFGHAMGYMPEFGG